jgi:uncharacterized paraquat-inducible protein A
VTENIKEAEGAHTSGKEVEEYKEEELIDERNDVRKVVRICPVCNLEIDEEASFCPHCAYKGELARKRNLSRQLSVELWRFTTSPKKEKWNSKA